MSRAWLIALAVFVVALAIDPEGTKNAIVRAIAFVFITLGNTLYDVICRLAS